MGNYTLPDQDCIPVVGSKIADVPTHRDYFRFLRGTGVLPDIGGMLEVSPAEDQGAGPAVTISDGQAWVVGHLWRLEDAQTLQLPAADLADDRTDLVVARVVPFDGEENGFGELAVVEGTPGGGVPSPVEDDGGVWELPLAQVTVEAAAAEVSSLQDLRVVSEETTGRPVIVDAFGDLAGVNVAYNRTAVVRDGGLRLFWYDPDSESWEPLIGEEPVVVDAVGDLDSLDTSFLRTAVVRDGDAQFLYWFDPVGESWQIIVGEGISVPFADERYVRAEELPVALGEVELRLWQLEADVLGEVEQFAGWHGEAFLEGQDAVASESGDISVSRGARLLDGSASLSTLPEIGEEFMGGFFAGIIDTDANSADIDANDTRQAGKRYALIVSPKGVGEPSTELEWRTSQTGVAEARTRWDGLYVTDYIIGGDAGSLSDFPIFEFCDQVRSSDPVPDDGGSDWYIPALDELELLYRHFKPGTEDNYTGERSSDFPDPWDNGYNPSSDPQGTAYTESDPEQTTVTAFQGSGGAETLQFEGDSDSNRLWSATEANGDRAWDQDFRGSSAGLQVIRGKVTTDARCRLVRRVEL